jgi:hypothetical protein
LLPLPRPALLVELELVLVLVLVLVELLVLWCQLLEMRRELEPVPRREQQSGLLLVELRDLLLVLLVFNTLSTEWKKQTKPIVKT